jgi:putative redox protein
VADTRHAVIRWAGHGLVFEGRTETSAPILLDSASKEGPSPTEALLMSLAACMAIDVKVILEKSRIPVKELVVRLEGDRADEAPRRFTKIRLQMEVHGPQASDLARLSRAAQLSHDKYCSVFHSLRPDLEVETSTSIV